MLVCSIIFTAGESADYTSDLLKLDTCSFHPLSGNCDPRLSAIATPLVYTECETLLQGHPDQRYVDYILSNLRRGFRIGFNRSSLLCAQKHNMQSHLEVVTRYLEEGVKAGRVLALSLEKKQMMLHGRLVIPKWHHENKWSLIVDLSRPKGASVNEGVDPSLCSLTYVRLDEVADTVCLLGRGTELAKADIRAA